VSRRRTRWLNPPNVLSLGRLLLVPWVAVLLVRGDDGLALRLVFLAGLTDLLDGWLARRFGWRTRLGSWLDPLADKSMTWVVGLLLLRQGRLPTLFVGSFILRDLGLVIWWLRRGHRPEAQVVPSRAGKLAAVAAGITLLAALGHVDRAVGPLAWFSIGCIVWSGVRYSRRWNPPPLTISAETTPRATPPPPSPVSRSPHLPPLRGHATNGPRTPAGPR